MTETQEQTSNEHQERIETAARDVPSWLRPFLSLRIQLVSAHCIVLILVIGFTGVMLHWDYTLRTGEIIASAILIGTLLAFFFTTLLLRPLWRVTDAAQAIALGDLEQR